MIYLDHAATTAVSKSVREAMLPYFSEDYGNPSSLYLFAQKAKKAVEDSRRSIAGLLGVNPREVYFTSGGTEADNWAILSAFYSAMGKKSSLSGSEAEQKSSLSGSEVAGSEVAGQKQRQPHIICSAIEHHAILESCKFAESLGARVSRIPVDSEGFLDLEALEQAITEDTVLISVMAANNEMGTIQDLRAIGEIAKKHGVLFHTDAVQAFGQIPLFLEEMGIDLLSASAHKLHGPKGVGLLVIRKGVRLPAFLHGGAQERGYRRLCQGGRGGLCRHVGKREKKTGASEAVLQKTFGRGARNQDYRGESVGSFRGKKTFRQCAHLHRGNRGGESLAAFGSKGDLRQRRFRLCQRFRGAKPCVAGLGKKPCGGLFRTAFKL